MNVSTRCVLGWDVRRQVLESFGVRLCCSVPHNTHRANTIRSNVRTIHARQYVRMYCFDSRVGQTWLEPQYLTSKPDSIIQQCARRTTRETVSADVSADAGTRVALKSPTSVLIFDQRGVVWAILCWPFCHAGCNCYALPWKASVRPLKRIN